MKIKIVLLLFAISFLISCDESELQDSIDSDEDNYSIIKSDIKTHEVTSEVFVNQLEIPALVEEAPDNISVVSSQISGIISGIHRHEGEYVSKGQALLTIKSIELAKLVYDYRQSVNDTELLEIQSERLKSLSAQNISSKREYEETLIKFKNAENEMERLANKLKILGIKPEDKIENNDEDKSLLTIYSQIPGYINELDVRNGMAVEMHDKLMTVVNPAKVLIKAFVSPEEALFVKQGDKIEINTMKETSFDKLQTTVRSIKPALDAENRSVVVNALLNTKNGFPKPGQTIRVSITSSTDDKMIRVPNSAIMFEDNSGFVYVKESTGFSKRNVTILNRNKEYSFISKGLNEGEIIAVTDVLAIKAEEKLQEEGEE